MNHETLTLLNLLAKGTAVLFFGLGGITFMRRYSAAQRSLAWLAVFAALLVLPLTVFVQPVWSIPVMTVKAELPLEKAAPISAVSSEAPNDTRSAVAPPISVWPSWSFWQWLGAVYISGVITILAFRLLGSLQLRHLKHETIPPDTLIPSLVNELRVKHRIHRQVEAILSDRITVPMTWGTLKPVLLLPADCIAWSRSDLQAALEHELAHIRHLDAARRWIATLVSALWWPHPLVWITGKAWRLEQERACDDAVVRSGADPGRYAEQLLQAAGTLRLGSFPSAAALVMAMPSGLETRLLSIMGTNLNRSATGKFAFSITTIASLLVIAICTACQAQTRVPAKAILRQIYITTKFVEVATEDLGTKHPALKKALEGTPVTLSDTEMRELVRQLSQKKGVHLMSAPSVTTRNGQRATMEVVREFIYPITFEKDSDTPTAFEMMPIGVIVDVEGAFQANGAIRLHPIESKVNEFLGYKTGGKLHPLSTDGRDPLPLDQMNMLTKKLPGDARDHQPAFSIRKWSGDVSLKQNQWLISYLKRTDDEDKSDRRRIWFFVSANEYIEKDSKKSDTAPDTSPPGYRLKVK